jgi:hypothetical protein
LSNIRKDKIKSHQKQEKIDASNEIVDAKTLLSKAKNIKMDKNKSSKKPLTISKGPNLSTEIRSKSRSKSPTMENEKPSNDTTDYKTLLNTNFLQNDKKSKTGLTHYIHSNIPEKSENATIDFATLMKLNQNNEDSKAKKKKNKSRKQSN